MHRIQNCLRFLRRGCGIEVRQRFSVELAFEDGEIRSEVIEGVHHVHHILQPNSLHR